MELVIYLTSAAGRQIRCASDAFVLVAGLWGVPGRSKYVDTQICGRCSISVGWYRIIVVMYLRETRRRNRDGSEVAYPALAHNERDSDSGMPKARIIHNFGRADLVDRLGLARLVKSISRFLDPADAVAATTHVGRGGCQTTEPMEVKGAIFRA